MVIEVKPEDFSPLELHLLIQHLKLGYSHLEKLLGKNNFKYFLDWGALNEQQENKLKASFFEKLSQALPVLNTIVTSLFGAFMGLAILLEFNQGDFFKFCFVCGLVVLIGGFMGYLSLKMIKNKARNAIFNLAIHKIQLRLLHLLNEKSEQELIKNIHTLNELSRQLSVNESFSLPLCQFKNEEEIQEWFNQICTLMQDRADNLPNENVYELYRREIARHLNTIRSHLSKIRKDEEGLSKKPTPFRPSGKKYSFIQVLTDPTSIPSKTASNHRSWVQENMLNILFQAIPTMLGAFASFFVFTNGLPTIAKKLGIFHSDNVFTHPYAQNLELIFMIFLTLYLGISSIYTYQREKQREKEIANFSEKIIAQEIEHLAKTNQLHALNEVKDHLIALLKITQFQLCATFH